MKKNFHFKESGSAGNSGHYEPVPPSANPDLVRELFQINRQLEEKEKLLRQKQIEQQRLKAEFYEGRPPEQQVVPTSNKVEHHKRMPQQDFYSKFQKNRMSQQEKMNKWRKDLEEQVKEKKKQKQQINEQNKKRQIADDLMEQLLREKREVATQEPKQQRKIEKQEIPISQPTQSAYPPAESRRLPQTRRQPAPQPFVNQFVRDTEEQMRIRRREEQQRHREALEQQILLEKQRKQLQKRQMKAHLDDIPPVVVPVEKPKKAAANMPTANWMQDKQTKKKQVANKYRKGLITLEEYELTLKKIDLQQPEVEKQTTQRQKAIQKQEATYQPLMPVQQLPQPPQSQQPPQAPHPAYEHKVRQPMPNSSTASVVSSGLYPQTNVSEVNSQQSHPDNSYYGFQQFQLDFMKKMFEQMNQLMKTNRVNQQLMQQVVMRNMMNMTTGTVPQMSMMGQSPMHQMYQPVQIQPPQAPHPIQIPTYPVHVHQPTHQKSSLPSYEQSLDADDFKIPYNSPSLPSASMSYVTEEQEQFYIKPTLIREFRPFSYSETAGASSNRQIPSTTVYLTSPDAKILLKRRFQADLAHYRKMQVEKHVQIVRMKRQTQPFRRVESEKTNVKKLQTSNKKLPQPEEMRQNDTKIVQQTVQNVTSPTIIESCPSQQNISGRKVQEMMKECLEQQTSDDDLAEVRRQLFRGPLASLNRHNQILEKFEYSQSAQQNQSLAIPEVLSRDIDSEAGRFSTFSRPGKPSNKSIAVSGHISSKKSIQPLEQQTIQSQQYQSIRKDSILSRPPIPSKSPQRVKRPDSQSPQKQCLQLSRKQLKNMKKTKDNVLIDFVVTGQNENRTRNHSDNEEIEQNIAERMNSRQNMDACQESATLVSVYEQSRQKETTVKKQIQKQPSVTSHQSNLTSLMDARKKARQSKAKEKKESIVSIEAIQNLQRQMKKSEHLTPPPVLVPSIPKKPSVNSKDLLTMLDGMAQDDADDYPQDFHSYRSGSRNDNPYKF